MSKFITKIFFKNYKSKKNKELVVEVKESLFERKVDSKIKNYKKLVNKDEILEKWTRIMDENNKEFSLEGKRLLNKLNSIEILLSNLSRNI